MSMWDEFIDPNINKDSDDPELKSLLVSQYENIYYNPDTNKYQVYATKLGKRHYVGTFDGLDDAYNAQVEFKMFNVKQLKRKKNTVDNLDERLSELLNDYHKRNP